MAKKSSSPTESSSPKQKSKSSNSSKSKKTAAAAGSADIRSFFTAAPPPKKLSFSDEEEEKPQATTLKPSDSKKDNNKENKDNNISKNNDSNDNNSNNNKSNRLSKLKKLKKETDSSSSEDNDDDYFSFSEEEPSNKKNNNRSKNSTSDKLNNNNDTDTKTKSIVNEKTTPAKSSSTPIKSKKPVSKKIDLTTDEETESSENEKKKRKSSNKSSSSSSNKSSNLKRKEKPESSSEDEKQEEKKRKIKTPEKATTQPQTPTKSTPTKSTPTKSTTTTKTPEKKVEVSDSKQKTPEKKTRVLDNGMEVDEVYLSIKPKKDDIFAENQVSAIPKRASAINKTPEKAPQVSKAPTPIKSPSKAAPKDEEMLDTEEASDTNKNVSSLTTSKSPAKKNKFNDDDIFGSPKQTENQKATTSATTTATKKSDKFNDDDIFGDSPAKNKQSATPIKKTPTKTAKKEKFDDDDIFNSPPESKQKPKSKTNSKFNEDSIFDDEETDSEEMKVDKPAPLSKKLKKAKEEEYADDNTESEETESEEEQDKKFKSKSSSTPSKSASSVPSKPTSAPSKPTPTPGAKSAKQMAFLNFKFGTREPPPNKGKKPLPVGKQNCLARYTFFISGVLDSLERDEAENLIKKYGGNVAKSAVKKLTHMIVGTGAGEQKLEKAKKIRGVVFIDEDGLFEMISKTAPQPIKEETKEEQEEMVSTPPLSSSPPTTAAASKGIAKPTLPIKPSLPLKPNTTATTTTTTSSASSFKPASGLQYAYTPPPQTISMSSIVVPPNISSIPKGHDQLWVEKYKPKDLKDLIGNGSVFEQLSLFLSQWNQKQPKDPNKRNAVLLSGPPGIGKTSAAILLCKLKGFEPIELNASDTRSKSEIERVLKGASDNQNISNFFSAQPTEKKKINAIILDEIDGSSGNSDRGGIAEIIQLIKKSKVPFICICNDYYSNKIKSLKNYCMDLRLKRPTAAQVTTRILQIAKHEDMKVTNYMVEKIFVSTHSDIRQTINTLQMLARSKKSYDNFTIEKAIESKDFDITPFSAVELLFKTSNGDINTQLEYFFSDFSLVPLLVQENYLSITPYGTDRNNLPIEKYSDAADAICDSDEIGRAVGKEMAWQLLPSYGVASSILPAGYVRGTPNVMPLRFPTYLGKYSNASKQQRFVKDLQLHMRSTSNTFSNRDETRLYYVPMLKHYLIEPLVVDGKEGIDKVINIMDEYGLTQDDRDRIIELSTWDKADILSGISAQLKTSFTKKFKAGSHAVYDHSLLTVTKGSGDVNIAEGYEEVEGEESKQLLDDEKDDNEDEDITKSKLIKKSSTSSNTKSKPKAKSTTTTTTTKSSKSKSKK
ncbi:hypothetical protein DICPUDRAFT_96642 [Dictyostelium purpureum]|uniref:BRCT domain-containing protein n=1 Tax=Dictyostelium purpureum TaxID=5786 RepID=F0ZA62_DICPU|nr:uncharacterized protein DICPUDRAFT_96642 [Dictyostelium purpureum]EGC39144.1 hypothetical protein DICPUDRAFT_96642 [Dictyostelium purpureum]|eukprot:XP_003284290.1 hypothetical protein DICPUDRAFT_96642 [Dictyostelium purpureum]